MKMALYKTLSFIVLSVATASNLLAQSSGTISIDQDAYGNDQQNVWQINAQQNKPLILSYEIDIESGDFVDIYEVDANNVQHYLTGLTGSGIGDVYTHYPTGKAVVVFTTDGYACGRCPGYDYQGFTINYSLDDDTQTADRLFVDGQSYVNGDFTATGNSTVGGSVKVSGNVHIHSDEVAASFTNTAKLFVLNDQVNYSIRSISSKSWSSSTYGIHSNASNSTGNVYGIYSTVSGVSGKKWAGYFNGGTVEINAGLLKANNGLTVAGGDVGIGTTSPQYKLDVSGTSRITGNATFSGNVGIGTTSPAYKLDVSGTSRITGNATFSGNVGIGTTTPQYKLDVNGIVHANEIILNTAGADFVFDENYRLRPLGELHTFIKENKHLPEIVPASIMEKSGMSISEMNTKLLQKIEELTLYLIQQENKLQKQETVIEELKSKINEMERK
ncbi:MAG: hypothetical protein LBG15_14615 [Dysgonamonadaceae bacterium]|jgi:hypothetical protein|nr:hypothetical protein [Dysgonamonadaceae bacterium]